MAYRFDPGEPLANEVRRIATEELDSALQRLADPYRGSRERTEGLEKSVHEVRKSCKKIRALVRIVRSPLGDEYEAVNATVRDASAVLSPLRDGHATLATFDALVETRRDLVPPGGLGDVRAALDDRARAMAGSGSADELLQKAAGLLAPVADRVGDWSLRGDLRVAIDGASGYHGRAVSALRQVLRDPTDDRLHEWRKRVKDGWYHTQLLTLLAPSVLGPREDVLHDLGDALGDNNDLAVLGEALRASPDEMGGHQARDALVVIEQVRHDLVGRCLPLGARVYAEDEKAHRRSLTRYLKAYRTLGPEQRVGDLAATFGTGDDVDR